MKPLLFVGALAASLSLALAEPSQAGARAQATAPEAATAPVDRTLVDRDSLRSIEVVTDRRESIAQFFARQKLVVASSATIDGKFVADPAQWAGSKPRTLFVSYPLFNDGGFRMNLFGAYYSLQPLSPAALALVRGQVTATAPSAPSSGRPYVILAPGLASAGNPRPPARLVGRIQVFGSWSPEAEAASLSYTPSRPAS